MSQFFSVHPETPQTRLIHQAVEILNRGGVIVYPTDSAYALGCLLDNKSGAERIKEIRRLPEAHNFTLICKDLSELSRYDRVDNSAYRQIKHATPGPYTFVFEASREVPRRIMNPKRKTIGLRVPGNAIAQSLLNELDAPLMSVTLIMPGDDYPLSDPYDIRTTLEHQVDLVIDGGYCGLEPTTVIDMSGDEIVLLRQGLGSSDDFV